MMTSFFEAPLTLHAIYVLTVAAIVSGLLSSFIVWRRLSLVGETLSHGSLSVVALALIAGVSSGPWLYPFAVVVALLLTRLENSKDTPMDSVVGLLYSGLMGLGILLMGYSGAKADILLRTLFGDIRSVDASDAVAVTVLLIGSLLFLIRHFKVLVLSTLQPDIAKVQGLNSNTTRVLFNILVCLVVVTLLKTMGVVLSTSLIIAPSLIATRVSRSLKQQLMAATILSMFISLFGLFVAESLKWPAGPTIATFSLFAYLLTVSIFRK